MQTYNSSVDAHAREIEILKNKWVCGCEQMIYDRCSNGWILYYITFTFRPLAGSREQVIQQMQRIIERQFYSRFAGEFAHHLRSPSEHERLPKLVLFPDLPILKRNKKDVVPVSFNSGLHYAGHMFIPPKSRLRECPAKLLERKRHVFERGQIDHIHAVRVDRTIEKVIDYAPKTVTAGRVGEEGIIILPKPLTELAQKPKRLDPLAKTIKDLQATYNVSREVARSLALSAHRS